MQKNAVRYQNPTFFRTTFKSLFACSRHSSFACPKEEPRIRHPRHLSLWVPCCASRNCREFENSFHSDSSNSFFDNYCDARLRVDGGEMQKHKVRSRYTTFYHKCRITRLGHITTLKIVVFVLNLEYGRYSFFEKHNEECR